jgi:hypothetical protein
MVRSPEGTAKQTEHEGSEGVANRDGDEDSGDPDRPRLARRGGGSYLRSRRT